jgi:hypothetical protein
MASRWIYAKAPRVTVFDRPDLLPGHPGNYRHLKNYYYVYLLTLSF